MMVGLVGQLLMPRRCPRHKQCVGRLSAEERGVWQESITPLKGSSPPWRRAPRLFTTAAEGPAGADGRPAEALHGRGPTSAKRRNRVGPDGLAWAREGTNRPAPPPPGPRDGEAAAPWLALRLGPPPSGYGPGPWPRLAAAMGGLDRGEASRDAPVRQGRKHTTGRRGRWRTG